MLVGLKFFSYLTSIYNIYLLIKYNIMTKEDVILIFKEKPYLLDMGAGKVSIQLKTSIEVVKECRTIVRSDIKKNILISKPKQMVYKQYTPRIYQSLDKSKNILIIGDTHLPYEHEGYLDFCIEQYKKWNCDTVIHIGDLIDSHATSRHPSMPDAYSPGDELQYTIRKLRSWYAAFPNMKVCIGNHDIRSYKLAAENGVASKWMRGFAEVLEVPTWEFQEEFEVNNIIYTHGTGTSGQNAAHMRALNLGQSVVMGHLHTESSIIHHRVANEVIFGMIVGCGINEKSYGMNYAKNFPKKSITSCGIILQDQPILILMK